MNKMELFQEVEKRFSYLDPRIESREIILSSIEFGGLFNSKKHKN